MYYFFNINYQLKRILHRNVFDFDKIQNLTAENPEVITDVIEGELYRNRPCGFIKNKIKKFNTILI